MDDVVGVQAVQVLALVQVPQSGGTVLTSCSKVQKKSKTFCNFHVVPEKFRRRFQENSGNFLTGSAERSVGGNSDGVDVTGVADQVGAELAVGQVPDLDELVPTSRDDDGVSRGGVG